MNKTERIFYHMVYLECWRNRCITDDWVRKHATTGEWSYDRLLEMLCKWSLDGVYTYECKIADGRLEFGKLYGVYKQEERAVKNWL